MPNLTGSRSLEGCLAPLMASFASALLVLYYGMHLTPGEALVASLWVAAAATLTEAISTHGTDNLTLQLVASAVAWWLGKA